MIMSPLFHGPGRLGRSKGGAGDRFASRPPLGQRPLGATLRPPVAPGWLTVLTILLVLGSTAPGRAQTTNRLARPDFSDFKIVAERNIFNPKRYARSGGSPVAAPKVTETITLSGTMSYNGKGPFAFFDSPSSEYRKVSKVSDTIAVYKVEAIEPSFVKLVAGTNDVQMRVGMQLRHEEGGKWELASTPVPAAALSSDAGGSGAKGSGASTDSADLDPVLKKLMERRNQENNR